MGGAAPHQQGASQLELVCIYSCHVVGHPSAGLSAGHRSAAVEPPLKPDMLYAANTRAQLCGAWVGRRSKRWSTAARAPHVGSAACRPASAYYLGRAAAWLLLWLLKGNMDARGGAEQIARWAAERRHGGGSGVAGALCPHTRTPHVAASRLWPVGGHQRGFCAGCRKGACAGCRGPFFGRGERTATPGAAPPAREERGGCWEWHWQRPPKKAGRG